MQKMKSQENDLTQIGIFGSRKHFIIAILLMGLIIAFYHQWYEILANKPPDVFRAFYRNFAFTSLESILRLLPLLIPFYLLLKRMRNWPVWKRFFLFLLLAVLTTVIEEMVELNIPLRSNAQLNAGSPRFFAFLSFDMFGDVLLFLGILSSLGYVDHILCRNHSLFMRLSEKNARLAEEEKLRLMAELEALQHQINPHFLFNTLNSLATLVVTNPAKAETLIRDMSDWYRDTLSTTQQKTWTIGDELELIQNYLNIESVRLGDRLELDIKCTKEARGIAVPPLILQPLVENAIQHGIAPSVSGGTVSVHIEGNSESFSLLVQDRRRDSDLVVENHNNGVGAGLQNVKRRFELAFGKGLQFSFELEAEGATVKIALKRTPIAAS